MAQTIEPANILIVDDDPDVIHLLSQILAKEGHQVRATKDSSSVLQIAESAPPDLFLLDINMPQISGYDLCLEIKKTPLLKGIPVIFVSAYDKAINKVSAFEAGGIDYINKPIHAREVVVRANTHIKLYRLQQRLEQQVEEQTKELEGTLTTLRMLMTQQNQDTKESEKHILANINNLVIPNAERLKKTNLDENQTNLVDILISNLQQISDSLIDNHDLLKLKLTPIQIQVANLIKEGKKTKEIAYMLNLSDLTISTHRKNIRKKLNLNQRDISLNAFLSSL